MSTSSQTTLPKVSGRSKKEEILSAYEDLLKKFQENAEKSRGKKVEVQRIQEDNLVQMASRLSMDDVLSGVSNLEGEIRKLLGKLSESLFAEVEKLKDLQEVINIEQKRLEEIHDIKVEADTLANLIQAYKDKKHELEEEYKAQEDSLEKEIDAQKEGWRREQEEYDYELQLKRRKEEADYEEKCLTKEKEFKDREATIKVVEDELKELRKLKLEFDQKLDEQMEQARLEAGNKARETEEMKAKILAEKNMAEKHIAELTIKSLEKKILDQEDDIFRLKKELEIANRGVKDIAIKVIEGDARCSENRRPLKSYEADKEKEEKFAE